MVSLLILRWKMAGQMKESMQPVKLPMKPIRMVKCGMTIANMMVTTTIMTRKPRPQTFSSPSRAQMVGNTVSGLP